MELFKRSRRGLAAAAVAVLANLELSAQEFRLIGTLPNGGDSQAFGVANGGATVAGTAEDMEFTMRAARWTSAGGLTAIALAGSSEGEGQAISADGSVIVGGFRNDSGEQRAFRWTRGGATDLGTITTPGASFAAGVSGDGNVVVGWSLNAEGQEQPFRWSASGGMENLGTFGGRRGFAFDANADGSVVVGAARDNVELLRAFRWSRAGGLQQLPVSTQGASEARAITADGRFIAGNDALGAFRWSDAGLTRIQPPSRLAAQFASDISTDGARIVGRAAADDFTTIATVWTEGTGSVDLNKAFAGVIPKGWTLVEATAISPDGNWIVGIAEGGFERQGFLLQAPQIVAPPKEFYFATAVESVAETAGMVRLVIAHDNPIPGTYSVRYTLTGVSATAGADFSGTSATITFNPGETSKEITIPILNDSLNEGEETLEVILSEPSNGMAAGREAATVWITDNDFGYEGPFMVEVSEADPFIEVDVLRTGDYNFETTVDVTPRAESAVAGVDFVANTVTLRFAPGATRATARIQLLNDSVADGSKFLSLVFTNPAGGIPAPETPVMVVIEDNEAGYMLGDSPVIIEGAQAQLRVQRMGDFAGASQARVTFSHQREGAEGTATLGQDFTASSTLVTFEAGQTSALVPANIIDDSQMEADESLFVTIESLSANIPAPEQAILVWLRDNDVNPAEVEPLEFTGNLNEILQAFPVANGKVIAHGQVNVSLETFREFQQVLRLNADGSTDQTFTPFTTEGHIGSVAPHPDGRVTLVEYPGVDARRIVRLNGNGAVDATFAPAIPEGFGPTLLLAAQADGGVIVSGRGQFLRVLPNGQIDPAFTSPTFLDEHGGSPGGIFPAVAPNGALFAHGFFATVNGVARPGLARLNADGSLDTLFAPAGEILVLVELAADGGALVYWDGEIKRLTATGVIDPSFTPFEGEHFVVTPAGKILRIRSQTQAVGEGLEQPQYWVERFTATGLRDETFAATTITTDNISTTFRPLGEERLLAIGAFSTVNGHPRAAIASVRVDGRTPKIVVAAPVWEDDGTVRIPILRTGDNSQPLQARFETADLSARAGTHYQAASGEVNFAAGESSQEIVLTLIDNTRAEADTMLTLRFTTTGGQEISASTLTIQNDDPGFLVSQLHLPSGPTMALRFTGRGEPKLESSQTLQGWLRFEQQPDKREILVPDTRRTGMEFFTFSVE